MSWPTSAVEQDGEATRYDYPAADDMTWVCPSEMAMFDRPPNQRAEEPMTTPDNYVGQCRGLVISQSESLPPKEVGWAMHLIDHDEPAEGLTSLAWSIESVHGIVDAETASLILELTDGMVPLDALPRSVQSVAGQSEGPAIVSGLLEALDEPAPAGLTDLGGRWDQRVREALVATLSNPVDRSSVVASLTKDQAWAWFGWAEGACSWAVRSGSADLLREVLGSLTILDQVLDRRDLSLVATLVRCAAEKLRLPWSGVARPSTVSGWPDTPQWILAVSAELPDTHVEVGSGASFEFRRNQPTFDPHALRSSSETSEQ